MNKTKPFNRMVEFEYKCIKCEYTHWLSERESKVNGFKISCECGNIINIEPVRKIKIRLWFDNKQKTNTSKHKVNGCKQKLKSMLIGVGYSAKEANTLINNCKMTNDPKQMFLDIMKNVNPV